ncbi:MAG: UxaA family hydrolase [Promethearchaeota archaeon]|jgi:altronate dehydratase small subunit
MKKYNFIVINPKDNCATALEEIPQNIKIDILDKNIEIKDNIPFGHKFAMMNIKKGSHIIKYGEVIGTSSEDISEGDWIHIHNITSSYLKVINNE